MTCNRLCHETSVHLSVDLVLSLFWSVGVFVLPWINTGLNHCGFVIWQIPSVCFLCKLFLTNLNPLLFHMNFSISLLNSMKNHVGIFSRIALSLQISVTRVFTILSLVALKHMVWSFHLLCLYFYFIVMFHNFLRKSLTCILLNLNINTLFLFLFSDKCTIIFIANWIIVQHWSTVATSWMQLFKFK